MSPQPELPSSSQSDDPAKPGAQGSAPEGPREPSLGPACLVVAILTLAVLSAVCGIGSWFMFSDQYPFAIKGITQQLIPWVATSQLHEADKRSITRQLKDLVPILEARQIDHQQLSRLHFCLQDNPILLWGGVQSIVQQAREAGLNETELTALERITQRLMWLATDRQLGRRDLEFTLQNCSQVREDGASIEVKPDLSAEQIRDFMTRSEQLIAKLDAPNEPYEKTPAEGFAILIDKALHPPAED